jgi:hypothetical protein
MRSLRASRGKEECRDDSARIRQIAVKASPEGDKLVTSGAHYLQMSKKDLVEAEVAF